MESEPDSDSENQSTTFYSDSEPEEVSEDNGFMSDNPKELAAACIKLCRKVHNNIESYNKIVLILDKLCHISCLSKEECDSIKFLLQEKIGMV